MRHWQRWGVKLPGKGSLTGSNNLKGAGFNGMVNIYELPLTYRHAAKV